MCVKSAEASGGRSSADSLPVGAYNIKGGNKSRVFRRHSRGGPTRRPQGGAFALVRVCENARFTIATMGRSDASCRCVEPRQVPAERNRPPCLLRLRTAAGRLGEHASDEGATDRTLHDRALHGLLDDSFLHGLLDNSFLHGLLRDSTPHGLLEDALLHGALHGLLLECASRYRSLDCFLCHIHLREHRGYARVRSRLVAATRCMPPCQLGGECSTGFDPRQQL